MTIDTDSICITKAEAESSRDGKVYTYTYTFKYTGTFSAITAIGGAGGNLPTVGVQLAEDTSMYCSNVICNQYEDPAAKMAELKATFKENIWIATDPTTKDIARFALNEEQRDIFLDKDEKVIVNAAGQVFSSSPIVNVGAWTVSVTGYRTNYTLPPYTPWHLVNSSSVTVDGITIPAKYARLVGVETERENINGYNVIRHTWTMKINNKEWDLKIPNMGYYEKVSGELKRIYRDGKPVEVPWPLATNGTALPKGFNPATDVTTKTFDITEEYDFNNFNWSF